MGLSVKQNAVLKGMSQGFGLSVVLLGAMLWMSANTSFTLNHEKQMLVIALLLVVSTLGVSIGLLAKYRFFSMQDIDGSHIIFYWACLFF